MKENRHAELGSAPTSFIVKTTENDASSPHAPLHQFKPPIKRIMLIPASLPHAAAHPVGQFLVVKP
jgi:hypothetical protein